MNALKVLKDKFRPVLAKYGDATDTLLSMIRPANDVKFGDFQANFAMPLGKKAGKSPRDIAEAILSDVDLGGICEKTEIAGPGFINLTLDTDWINASLTAAMGDQRLGVAKVERPRNYIVDYSSPNVAKPLHVGHIRSTVIGDAIAKILTFLGHHVKSDNHLGDWGTQFGMIIYGYKHFRDDAAFESAPIEELLRLYRTVRQLINFIDAEKKLPAMKKNADQLQQQLDLLKSKQPSTTEKSALKKLKKEIGQTDKRWAEAKEAVESAQQLIASTISAGLDSVAAEHPNIGVEVLQETAKLHRGDAENRGLWDKFLPICKQDMQSIYDRLDVRFDMELGESFYHDMLSDVVEDLKIRGLATESDGAMCVFLDDFETPMIIRKKDGAFLYSTTDLATIKYRMKQFDADACLYVVDHRQHEHFEKLFAVAKIWGYDDAELKHVSFGTVMGKDGRPYQTRSGDTVGLAGLLDEAENRAAAIAKEVDAELSAEKAAENGRVVGIGSLKYADLSHNRASDYVFDYDKMLALKGNTAAYLQYGYARVQGIMRKVDVDIEPLRQSPVDFELATDVERELAVQLTRFSEALEDVLVEYRPNLLCTYLFELCQTFFKFFDQCTVKDAASESLQKSRLQFCDLTARTIKTGLALLGIGVLDKM